MKNNIFDDIDKEKKELPRLVNVKKELTGKREMNWYQGVAVILLVTGLLLGVLIGNLMPACTDFAIGGTCTNGQFNFSLMLIVWIVVAILSLFIYGLGHIVNILESIDKKIK